MNKTIISASVEETEAFGKEIGESIEKKELPLFVALFGDLGVGKTAFVRGLASVLAKESIVRSPTFTIVNEYRTNGSRLPLFHFDMYRIEDEDELYSIGFYDYLDKGVCVVEWSENIAFALPERYLKVEIKKTSVSRPDGREISAILV